MRINIKDICGASSEIPAAAHGFPQTLRLLATNEVGADLLKWASLRTIWPEYGKFYWPAVDVTEHRQVLTEREKAVVRSEWVVSPHRQKGGVLVLLFWQDACEDPRDELDNVVFVHEDKILSFDAFKVLDVQTGFHPKQFWTQKTAGFSFKFWFLLAVQACKRKILFNKLGYSRPFPES